MAPSKITWYVLAAAVSVAAIVIGALTMFGGTTPLFGGFLAYAILMSVAIYAFAWNDIFLFALTALTALTAAAAAGIAASFIKGWWTPEALFAIVPLALGLAYAQRSDAVRAAGRLTTLVAPLLVAVTVSSVWAWLFVH